MHHDYSSYLSTTELWSTSPEWTSMIRQEALKLDADTSPEPEPTTQSGLVALGVAIGLFLVGIGTLAIGTARVTEGAASINQAMASTPLPGWQDLP